MSKEPQMIPKIVRGLPKGEDTNTMGVCEIDKSTIFIRADLTRIEELDTHIHESLHYADPILTEEEVQLLAYITSRTLWKAGYRKM